LEKLFKYLQKDVEATRNWIGGASSGVLPKGNIHEQKQKALQAYEKALEKWHLEE
jgi:hypothetical protein